MQSGPKSDDLLGAEAKVSAARVLAAKVLIVDDDYYTRKVIRTLLAVVGIVNVHDAVDGASGLEAIRKLRPDIVLLASGMNGPPTARVFYNKGRADKPFDDKPDAVIPLAPPRKGDSTSPVRDTPNFSASHIESALWSRVSGAQNRPRSTSGQSASGSAVSDSAFRSAGIVLSSPPRRTFSWRAFGNSAFHRRWNRSGSLNWPKMVSSGRSARLPPRSAVSTSA